MHFIIWKQKNKYRMYSNQIFSKEEDALEFAKKSFKRKDKWRVVDYNSENYDKYWYQFIYIIRNSNVVVINKPNYLYIYYNKKNYKRTLIQHNISVLICRICYNNLYSYALLLTKFCVDFDTILCYKKYKFNLNKGVINA